MSEHCNSDAAYVVGALSPADRHAFEDHLRDCARCQASVRLLAGLPGLLALASADDGEEAGQRVPESLLPGLATRVATTRRRRRWVLGSVLAASIAAALVLAGTVLVRPPVESVGASAPGSEATTASAAATAPPVEAQPMTEVLAGPMTASLELVDKKWGTAITVICQYDQDISSAVAYDLTVIDTDGRSSQAGTWRAVPGVTARVNTATAVPRDRIASLEVRLPDGRTILRSGP